MFAKSEPDAFLPICHYAHILSSIVHERALRQICEDDDDGLSRLSMKDYNDTATKGCVWIFWPEPIYKIEKRDSMCKLPKRRDFPIRRRSNRGSQSQSSDKLSSR